jgi:SAM-dependent methyltransferase
MDSPVTAACRLCGDTNSQVVIPQGEDYEYGVTDTFDLVRCRRCGLLFLRPEPTLEQLLTYYPPDYHSYGGAPSSPISNFLIQFASKAKAGEITRLIGPAGRILDVGCAEGREFDHLRRFGDWNFCGVEFNPDIAARGRAKGYDIRPTTLEHADFPPESFDLILMFHLLEHVTDPLTTLNAAWRLLKPGGYLLGEVPNPDSLDARWSGRYWGGWHFPRHLFQYNPAVLHRTLAQGGFRDIHLAAKLHTGHWALSIQNFLQSRPSWRSRLSHGRTFYYPLLLLFFIPFNLVQALFLKTGVIGFQARNRLGGS